MGFVDERSPVQTFSNRFGESVLVKRAPVVLQPLQREVAVEASSAPVLLVLAHQGKRLLSQLRHAGVKKKIKEKQRSFQFHVCFSLSIDT